MLSFLCGGWARERLLVLTLCEKEYYVVGRLNSSILPAFPDNDGRSEAELADFCWRNHLLRNHNIIFTLLIVPIAKPTYRVMSVVVVPLAVSHITGRCECQEDGMS